MPVDWFFFKKIVLKISLKETNLAQEHQRQ